eukprot:8416509-Karenia_brevis.AAC.1
MQCEPQELEDTGWLQKVRGVVIAPDQGTCRPSERIIDFFVVSEDLASRCVAKVLWGHRLKPHRPVKLSISGKNERWIQVRRGPKAFPVERPIGCVRCPPEGRWEKARAAVAEECTVQSAWQVFMDAAEDQLVDVYLIDPTEHGRYKGRAASVTM